MKRDPENPSVEYLTDEEMKAEERKVENGGLSPREQRRRRRQERKARIARKQRIAAMMEDRRQAIGPAYVNSDPLVVCDSNKQPTSVLHDFFRPVLDKTRAGFLCCGGPSYRQFDVSKLNLPGVATVGINNTSRDLNVNFAVFSDPAEKFHHGIMLDHNICKFVPEPRLKDQFRIKHHGDWHKLPFRVKDCPNTFGFKRNQNFEPSTFLTEDSACWGVDKKALTKRGNKHEKMLNTFFLGLRVCHYLGIRRLYLLGVDFNMSRGQEYAFAPVSGNEGRHVTNKNSYRIATSWCRMLKPYFDAAGFEVYNCNPDSALDVFPHVPFDYAVKDAIGSCPQAPYDFFGWYDKCDHDEDWSARQDGDA